MSILKAPTLYKSALWLAALAILLSLIPAPATAQGPLPPPTPAPFIEGELVVKFKPNVRLAGARGSLQANGMQLLEVAPHGRLLRIQVPPGREAEFITRLMGRGDVELAAYNQRVEALETPNDPSFSLQWSLDNTDQNSGTTDADIDAPEAWTLHSGGSGVTIAVIDTGVDLDHPDLQANIVGGYDFVNNDNSANDDHGHGTHVAGIAAAVGNNGVGIAGVSWRAKIMPLKVLDSGGSGSTFDVANAIYYAADNGAKVINMSLGARYSEWPCGWTTVENALDYALDHDVFIAVASGNDSQNGVNCPGAYDQVMAVGATNWYDSKAYYSNYGTRLDIVAPGGNGGSTGIYSTYYGGGYTYLSGTSMATPHVAGLAALIRSFQPSLSQLQVREVIESTADDLGVAGWDLYYGHGRINAYRALDSLVEINLYNTSGQAIQPPLTFLTDDETDPTPSPQTIQVTTTSPEPITWSATITPAVSWVSLSPPDSGQISASSSEQFSLQATRPATYGLYTTTLVVTGTTSTGGAVGQITTEVNINYLPELYRLRFPIIFK